MAVDCGDAALSEAPYIPSTNPRIVSVGHLVFRIHIKLTVCQLAALAVETTEERFDIA